MSREVTIRCDGRGCAGVLDSDGEGSVLSERIEEVPILGNCEVTLRIAQDRNSADYAEDLCERCRVQALRVAWNKMGEHLSYLEREAGLRVLGTH